LTKLTAKSLFIKISIIS